MAPTRPNIRDEAEGRLQSLGIDLVSLDWAGSKNRPFIRLRIERSPMGDPAVSAPVTVDDCARVSRALESWLDEHEDIPERYVLEVSSPGVERPVRWPRHWLRHVGAEVKVKVPGRGRVKALIVSVDEDRVVLRITLNKKGETEDFDLKISDSLDARLAWDWD